MGRSLKYEIPGPDWRRSAIDLSEQGVDGLFRDTFEPPFDVVVEVGFGRGEFLLDLAAKSPGTAFIGIEVSFKRVLKMTRKLARSELCNVRLLEGQAQPYFHGQLGAGRVREIWINFSDPWPKDRHAHRRLIQPAFIADAARTLASGGLLHIATDHVPYAEQIDAALAAEPMLENRNAPSAWLDEVPGRMHTGYESEWRAEGRPLHFFEYARPGSPAGAET